MYPMRAIGDKTRGKIRGSVSNEGYWKQILGRKGKNVSNEAQKITIWKMVISS
ncbi:hypothetical protein [Neobacillus mesonae]|uniref:hypothetical protein n=1 Tax=Neobacillus mesonae TaxID=1193713 RepID=UPI000AAA0A7B|nr:hypothetical protein [Neobacillus mesonae]